MNPVIELNTSPNATANTPLWTNVSLAVPPGVVFALLGENGAGKTTAIRLMLGLTDATAGEVRVLGLDSRSEVSKSVAASATCPSGPRSTSG